jgi:predicted  nucleic acid-binding Zn-ribbon protein
MDPIHHKLLQKLASTTDELEMKLRSKEQDLEAIIFQKDELQLKVSNLEEKVNGYKHKLLALEKRVTEYESEKDFLFGKEVTQSHKMRYLEN